MRKNQVQRVVLHWPEERAGGALGDRLSEFHRDILERRLAQSGLTARQQIAAIDQILERRKAKESSGLQR
ncbi:MAG TPA: hypothetical protein H9694_05265 [Firmicutes bacterium]|nr:hypothetical protein [Bacillota bacterium]